MAKDVLCEVNSCRFWDSGNKCGAETIYIVSKKEAKTSSETDCKTFETKQLFKIKEYPTYSFFFSHFSKNDNYYQVLFC